MRRRQEFDYASQPVVTMIKAVAAIFVLYGAYVLCAVYVQPGWLGIALAAASLAAGIGLASQAVVAIFRLAFSCFRARS